MNKIIITLLISSITLFANITQVQTYYDAKAYEDAIKEAKSSSDDFSNPHLHLLWAKSAEKLGRDEEAMSAYERVEMLDENNIDARVALVDLYKRTGRDELAFSASKGLSTTSLSSFKAYGSLAVGHDNNINIAPNELGDSSVASSLSTLFARVVGSASYMHDIEEKGAWYGRGDLQIYNQTNFDLDADDFDLFLGSISLGAGYAGNGYDIYIPIGIDNVQYLSSNLLTQIKLKPRVTLTLSNELIVNASASYISRSYNQTDFKSRDDTAYGATTGLYYLLGERNYIYFNLAYDVFSAEDATASAGTYVDKSLITANLGMNYTLASWLVMKADYRLRSASYDDNDRDDTYHQAEVKLSHYFADMFEAFVSDRYIQNSSSLTEYEYDKNIFMLGVAVNY